MPHEKAKDINHIALAVRSLSEAENLYVNALGLTVRHREVIEDQGVNTSMLKSAEGQTSIELLEPLDDNSPISKFLDKRGEGIHHICFEVSDIEQSLKHLKELNLQLIDESPRIGAYGARVAFVHPKSMNGVLVELAEFSEEKA
ncbi:MAG: methylmalonyl-CoA epimerase [Candidatus Dadabacteria bacterium]|nr:methylmalonyl-CoA epimerase [Candidatus Dadabacteria bacterium]NIS09100.1 methylmalonyl-CoA epimerase [Candidatus Dadabacteria bacterium]NIV41536.1 methylmalonyl-CoA epimerase [Candidatus Dadabacteria bacterium]NIX15217.1 methylmalonyl-CoA epimerase [Candidatus Dadabacteria bacterium]NIY21861.1 methylmalonyl-CoA epimerase [Candidatus Dadabacteria bacterium]